MIMIGQGAALAQIQLIHQTNTVWSYHTNIVDPAYTPADAWTAPLFDDSSWPTGKGYFGFETTPAASYNPGAAVVNPCNCFSGTYITPPGGAGGVSSYFRTHFNWVGGTQGVIFNTTNWNDDAVVVYLNGTVLFSFNVSATKVLPMLWNDSGPSGAANPLGEGVGFVTNVIATGLVAGDNVLAVQLEQQGAGSSDDVFTMAAWGLTPTGIAISQQPTNITTVENRNTNLTVVVTGTLPRYQWYKGTNPAVAIPDATNATYVFPNTTIADSGNYFVTIGNFINSVTSRVARVTVSNDTNGPVLVSIKADEYFDKFILTWDESIAHDPAIDNFGYHLFDPEGAEIFVATIEHSGNVTVLHAPSALRVGTNYTLEIDGQLDLVGNPTLPVGSPTFDVAHGVKVTGKTWVYTPGLTKFQAYLGLPAGQNIALFTAMPIYPGGPTFSFVTNIVNWPQSAPNIEQYVMRFSGVYVAPESGLFKFDPSHDDDMRLRVYPDSSTNGTPTELAAGCCTALTGGPTADVTLMAGQRYFYELIVREYGGGDYAGIAVTTPSVTNTLGLSGPTMAIAVDPDLAPNVGFSQQPQNQSVEVNHTATFSVTVTNFGGGASYQWQRNVGAGFTDILAANSAIYTTPLQALTNNGNQFRAVVSVPGRTITSSAALLTVVNDTNKPHVTTVVSGNTLPIVSVRVSFDELMDGTMLGNLAKYTLTGSNNASVALSAPVVAANNLSVTFTTPALTLGAYYTLHAQDVPDAAGNPLAATNIVFQAGRGTVVMETYDTSSTPGTGVALLTAHPNYPNSPRETFLLPTWDSRNAYPDDSHEQYGARISGWFIAPTTTNYIFYLRSDDASELWLSTDNSKAAKVKIQEELGCCGAFSAHASLPKALVAGKAYYMELLYKEGGGGDFGQAAVKTAGDPTDPNSLTPIPGSFVSAVDPTVPGLTLRSSRSGGTITLSWDAPARLQYTTSLTPPINWVDVITGGATTYSTTPTNEFNVSLDTAQSATPTAGRTGSGRGTITLSNNVLKVNVSYSGLSAARNNAHFHAPAARGVSAGVAYDLASISTGTTSGTILGDVPLVNNAYSAKAIAAQIQDIRGSLWYLNIHSTAFTGGEIRGQVEPATRFYRLISP